MNNFSFLKSPGDVNKDIAKRMRERRKIAMEIKEIVAEELGEWISGM